MILAAAVLLPCLSQTASADTVATFSCGAGTCLGGPVSAAPPNYSATGANSISGLSSNIPAAANPFTFSFDTLAGTASLVNYDSSDSLFGTIATGIGAQNFFGSTTINFGVLWNLSSAPDVAYFLGASPDFGGMSSVMFQTKGGLIDSASISINSSASPVPEPGTIALLGTGLLICGRLLRRKKQGEEEVA
jgi:hypothetical protein